jgi:signal transduction histidine kinase
MWELSVGDNGPGIPAEYHERSFRIFHTLAGRDKADGPGIGLAIVKRLVDDRGGRVWIDSEPGKGAKFCFTWPKSGIHCAPLAPRVKEMALERNS